MKKKRIYLAGPDVFFRAPAKHFAALSELCAEYGFEGVVPSDGGLSQGATGTGDDIAERIYRANIELIKSCDGILANLMPFRGAIEPDSGTVFEVGFAVALGIPVAGYLPKVSQFYEEKVERHFGKVEINGQPFDEKYEFLIETLQQPMNLMLSRSIALFGEPMEALAHLKTKLS